MWIVVAHELLTQPASFSAVARRIEIELTSRGDDGRFTWRAAGAREPRGAVDAALLPNDAAVGDVLRAEVETGLDGVDVLSIVPRKAPSPLDLRGESIERIAPPQADGGVQVTLAAKSGRGRRPDARDERGSERGPRPPRAARGARTAGADRPSRPRRPAEGRGGASEGDATGGKPTRGAPSRRGSERRSSERRESRRPAELQATTVHRNALLATLRPEQLPIAEQLLRGGLPAVRLAIDEQNRAALAQGRPTVGPETILAIADDLLPLTTLAAWKDRADAVKHAGTSVRLRDLRAVVTAARTVTLDEEGRAVLKELQGVLHTKTEELRTQWLAKAQSLLEAGNVAEALGVVSRPPDPGTRCPAELAASLADAAGTAMTDQLTATAWIALLDAVVASPIRRSVRPAGIPAAEEAQAAAVRAAGHVPALAKLLGMRIPPPPPPAATKRPALSGRRSS
jgi:hypothetical protein